MALLRFDALSVGAKLDMFVCAVTGTGSARIITIHSGFGLANHAVTISFVLSARHSHLQQKWYVLVLRVRKLLCGVALVTALRNSPAAYVNAITS